jgi:Ser/Thr protein kinase RdoA (MazF antagonist)
MALVEQLLRRHGLSGPATRVPIQGKASEVHATASHIIKIAHPHTLDEVYTEAVAAPAARAAGVRTPALVAWAREPDRAYSIWERIDGPLLDEEGDPAGWREVGRQLARLHTIDRCDDPRGVLVKPDKRDALPHLAGLPVEQAAFFGRWLERLERAAPGPRRIAHYDLHENNVLCPPAGATLIDWGDAAWADPAHDFGALPVAAVAIVLAGYEEVGSLGPDAEARILRALVGQSVRLAVRRQVHEPLAALLAFLPHAPDRFRAWMLPNIPA